MSRYFFDPKTLKDDVIAGLVLGIESVPDGLAQGLLATVNPVYGLYAYMMGTFSGAFFTSSVFMAIQATSAMSLIVASVPQVSTGENADAALFTLSLLTGLAMLIAGLLKLGRMLRFVPNAVMVGFINAVAILIVLGQLGDLTGYDASGANKVTQTFDLLRNMDQILLPTLLIGIVTILLILVLEKTRLDALGMVAAIVVSSLFVQVVGWADIATVADIAEIPTSLPRPVLPSLSLIPGLVIPALSLAFVGLVQGAGVSKNYVNPDGNYPDPSGDFVGQGAANLFVGLFQGMPVGGSVSATSLVTSAGARTRFANIFAGITIAAVILLFGGAVKYIALPAIAGLLIVVGFRTLKPNQIEMVWKTGRMQQVVMSITFIACLLIPLQYAVLVGVALAVLLYMVQESNQVSVKSWEWEPGDLPIEHDAPENVPSEAVTVLHIYGSVFFASASVIEGELPAVTDDTTNAAVILILRGEDDLGSTFLDVLSRYATELQAHNSKLLLAEVSSLVKTQMNQTKIAKVIDRDNIFAGTEKVGGATTQAWDAAQKWLAAQPEPADDGAAEANDDVDGDNDADNDGEPDKNAGDKSDAKSDENS